MPCKEYEDIKSRRDMERSTFAQYTYPENRHLQGGVSASKAKEIARDAQARATRLSREMQWHRDHCEECKKAGVQSV